MALFRFTSIAKHLSAPYWGVIWQGTSSVLAFNGTAEYTENDSDEFESGKRYAFLMFSTDENLSEVIEDVANFLGDLGWNQIDIRRTKDVSNETELEDGVVKEAFDFAKENRFAVILYPEPVDELVYL